MYDEILLPTDGSDPAAAAARHARSLATAFDATLHVLGVVDVDGAAGVFDAGGVDEAFVERLTDQVRADTEAIDAGGARVERATVQGDPADAILDYAEEHGIGMLVMGTHGRRGVRRLVAGSVTERVLRLAERPVFTVRGTTDGEDETDPDYERVLVATDGSAPAERAAEHGVAVAAAFDATVHALNVVDVSAVAALSEAAPADAMLERLREQGETATTGAADRAREAGLQVETAVLEGFPSGGILDYAEDHGIDLIVMGTHGRTGLDRVLLGSTAERTIRRAEVPVCAVPPADREDE